MSVKPFLITLPTDIPMAEKVCSIDLLLVFDWLRIAYVFRMLFRACYIPNYYLTLVPDFTTPSPNQNLEGEKSNGKIGKRIMGKIRSKKYCVLLPSWPIV